MSARNSLLFLIIFLWLSNAIGQSRRAIINSIRDVKIETINASSFNVEEETIRVDIKRYFKRLGYKLELENDSMIVFATQVNYVAESPYRSWKRNGRHYPRLYCTEAFVDITINQLDTVFQLDVYPHIDTQVNTSKNPRPSNAVLNFQEFRLREYLYERYYGDDMPIPDRIMASVDQFNSAQSKERRKILQGRDY